MTSLKDKLRKKIIHNAPTVLYEGETYYVIVNGSSAKADLLFLCVDLAKSQIDDNLKGVEYDEEIDENTIIAMKQMGLEKDVYGFQTVIRAMALITTGQVLQSLRDKEFNFLYETNEEFIELVKLLGTELLQDEKDSLVSKVNMILNDLEKEEVKEDEGKKQQPDSLDTSVSSQEVPAKA